MHAFQTIPEKRTSVLLRDNQCGQHYLNLAAPVNPSHVALTPRG